MSGHGTPALRQALAAYLNRVRGTSAKPEQIVICNGYAQGIGLLIQTLALSGAKRLALEDPSADDDALPLARAAGLEIVAVPVDDDGSASTGSTARRPTRSSSRRRTNGPPGPCSRPSVAPPCCAGRANGGCSSSRTTTTPSTATTGRPSEPCRASHRTSSPTRGPRARRSRPDCDLAGSSCPPRLVDAVADAKQRADRGSPVLDQLAFADFLNRGEFDRHLRRMRPLYRRRRDALLAALQEHAPELEPAGIAAGLHLVAYLPDGADETAVVQAAARRGLASTGWRRIASPARAAQD